MTDFSWVVAFLLGGSNQDFSALCPQAVSDWTTPYSGWLSQVNRSGLAALFDLPPGVSLASLRAGNTQYAKFSLGSMDVSVGLSVGNCPAEAGQAPMPWFQAYCIGADCKALALPCNTNSDCAGSSLSCVALKLNSTGGDLFSSAQMFDKLKSPKFVYDDDDASPGCLPVTSMLQSAIQFAQQNMFLQAAVTPYSAGSTTQIRVCAPAAMTSVDEFLNLVLRPEQSCPSRSTVRCCNFRPYAGAGAPSTATVLAAPPAYPTIVPDTSGARVLFYWSPSGDMYIAPGFVFSFLLFLVCF